MINGKTQRTRIPANLVGPNIRRLRVERGWSQAKLAMQFQLRGLDIGREFIAQIEAQTHCVKDRDLHNFARVLEVELSELFPPIESPLLMARV